MISRTLRERLQTQQWFLAVRDRATADDAFLSTEGYARLPQPRNEFRADPFLLERGDETWLFFEQYRYRDGKGHIAAGRIEQSADGLIVLADVQPALTQHIHLSYPCVFCDGGELWMIPETNARRTVELYRCRTFPHDWQRHRILLQDIVAADATPFRHGEHWWLLTAQPAAGQGSAFCYQLRLFYSRNLDGPWLEHPLSPIRSASRGTRPAGMLFSQSSTNAGDRLLWPTQDCDRRYGGSIHFREIQQLTPDAFVDAEAGDLQPALQHAWAGLHTYQCSSRYEVIDGLRLSFQPDLKLQGLAGKVRQRLTSGSR